jgi:hypothetical protein
MVEPATSPPNQTRQPAPPNQPSRPNQPSQPDQYTQPIQIEVAFAKPEVQVIVPLQVPPATTAAEAIQRSELGARFPELEPLTYKYGIFGKVCTPDQTLRDGDRVEIYRPLIADPKQVRRDRAAKGKKTRKGAKAISDAPATTSDTTAAATPAPTSKTAAQDPANSAESATPATPIKPADK